MEVKDKGRLILIADDDPEDMEMLETAILEVNPNNIMLKVYNGREAVDYLQQCSEHNLPSAIILDYNMPLMNGYEVLKLICSNRQYDSMYKFIWSTSNLSVNIKQCLTAGALAYFVKPLRPDHLKHIVNTIFAAID